jgi:two-component system phosphate regulon sensor histidine kinase PhoR
LDALADQIASALRVVLDGTATRVSSWAAGAAPGEIPPNSVLLLFGAPGVGVLPPDRLLYVPWKAPSSTSTPILFAAIEQVEFREERFDRAAMLYSELAQDSNQRTRAEALLRLGRVLLKQGKREQALAVYRRLEAEGKQQTGDVPAELVARHASADVLFSKDRTAAKSEAVRLRQELLNARWTLTRGQFTFYWSEVARLLEQEDRPAAGTALAEAATAVWGEYQQQIAPPRVRSLMVEGTPFLVISHVHGRQQATLITTPAWFLNAGLAMQTNVRTKPSCRIVDENSKTIAGNDGNGVRTVVRGLPIGGWTLSVAHAETTHRDLQRERFLTYGLGAMLGFLLLATALAARTIRREAAVAHLQADFVSAVSHEFRSPLTAMHHISEMLVLGRVHSDDRKQQYYVTLLNETRRLQKLVEGLLNFGRMEAGAKPYRFAEADVVEVIRQVTAEFEPLIQADGRHIETVIGSGAIPHVYADIESLSLALRNLIDNALKYSPGRPCVWVECQAAPDQVAIVVRDEGVGMTTDERSRIFQKFVRGSAAERLSSKGTGVGLALVDHIIRAHGGRIEVESEWGRGSGITLFLPAVKKQ